MDGRKNTSAENGKKGGRPISTATLETQVLREYITKRVIKEKAKIVTALINKAKDGDIQAAKELFDRAVGKARESLDVTSGGKPIPISNIFSHDIPDNDSDKEDSETKEKD